MIGMSPVGALILDDLTIDEFYDVYQLCKSTKVEELEAGIRETNVEMDKLKTDFKHVVMRHEEWIQQIRQLTSDQDCKNPEVIVRAIQLHEGEIQMARDRFDVKMERLRDRLQDYRDQRSIIWAAKHHTLQQIREFALKKYQKDISKPKPYSRAKKPEEIPEEWEDS